MSKVYTKTGDKGTTGLYTGQRVEKGSLRVEAYGTVDESQAALGLARALAKHEDVKEDILRVEKELWLLMADVASIGKEANITEEHVSGLEETIDRYDARLKPLSHFLVPGDTHAGACLDVARTVVRRAERCFWRLRKEEEIHEVDIRYLNRLSDLCFILGRVETEL